MQNKWKATKLYQRWRDLRISRTAVLTATVILLSLSVVLAVTVATNRAKRTQGSSTGPTVTLPLQTPATEPNGTNSAEPPADSVPEMSLPVQGKLAKRHSVDVQVFSQTMQDFRVHLGIDVATSAGADVRAAADGVVKKIWEDPMMGWSVALEHSGECVTVYKNLSAELAAGLAEGASVKQGQLLGTVGDSALLEIADEPHLHMEMTVKGIQVDPLDYFSASVIASLSEDTAFEEDPTAGK